MVRGILSPNPPLYYTVLTMGSRPPIFAAPLVTLLWTGPTRRLTNPMLCIVPIQPAISRLIPSRKVMVTNPFIYRKAARYPRNSEVAHQESGRMTGFAPVNRNRLTRHRSRCSYSRIIGTSNHSVNCNATGRYSNWNNSSSSNRHSASGGEAHHRRPPPRRRRPPRRRHPTRCRRPPRRRHPPRHPRRSHSLCLHRRSRHRCRPRHSAGKSGWRPSANGGPRPSGHPSRDRGQPPSPVPPNAHPPASPEPQCPQPREGDRPDFGEGRQRLPRKKKGHAMPKPVGRPGAPRQRRDAPGNGWPEPPQGRRRGKSNGTPR